MANPYQVKPNDGNGCIVHAGILTPHGGDVSKAELTSGFPEAAKDRFIKEVVERLTFNVSLPFPCGLEISPLPADQSSLLQDLSDEKKYPDFHAQVLGHYRDVARAFDTGSEFNLLPICDPIALGFKLGVDIKIPSLPDFMNFAIPNIPALAMKLDLSPIELAAKIPDLKPPLPPALPNFNFNVPLPPDAFLDLYLFRGIPPEIKFGNFILNLTAQMPEFIIKLITLDLPGFLGNICKLAREGLFTEQSSDDKGVPQDVVRIIATEVLARKIMEMSIMVALAKTVGTAPNGLTGQFAIYQEYSPPQLAVPPDDEDPEERVRRIIVDECEAMQGIAWSDDNIDADYLPYTQFIFPRECSISQQSRRAAHTVAEQASSCGLVARTALARAGATFVFDLTQKFDRNVIFGGNQPSTYNTKDNKPVTLDYFNDVYYGGAVSALIAVAEAKGAFIYPGIVTAKNEYWTVPIHELPRIKRGDIIVIGSPNKNNDHVMVVVEDYEPGKSEKLVCVHGGQLDQNNIGTASYIKPSPKDRVRIEAVVDEEAGVSRVVTDEDIIKQQNQTQSIAGGTTIIETDVVSAKKGMRCTGIQRIELYHEDVFKKKGLKLNGGGNLMGMKGIGMIRKVDAGVAGKGVIALGERTVKALIDSAILVLGKKPGSQSSPGSAPQPGGGGGVNQGTNDVDTTKVGKDFIGSVMRLLPPNIYEPGVDNNNEAQAGEKEIPLEESEAAAKDPALMKAREDQKAQKKKAAEDKKKAAEEKKAATLESWKKK